MYILLAAIGTLLFVGILRANADKHYREQITREGSSPSGSIRHGR